MHAVLDEPRTLLAVASTTRPEDLFAIVAAKLGMAAATTEPCNSHYFLIAGFT